MFKCSICNYETYRKYNLCKHLKSNKHVSNVQAREEEERRVREEHKHFVCDKCGKRFPANRDLTRHANRVNPCVEPVYATTIINNDNRVVNQINIIAAGIANDNIADIVATLKASTNVSQDEITEIVNRLTTHTYDSMARRCLNTDERNVLTFNDQFADGIESAQVRFDKHAKKLADLARSELEYELRLELRLKAEANSRGEYYKEETINVDSYKVDITKLIKMTFFDDNIKHCSLIREPDLDDNGRWLAKYRGLVYDRDILCTLISNCPEYNHFSRYRAHRGSTRIPSDIDSILMCINWCELSDPYYTHCDTVARRMENKRKAPKIRRLQND